MRDFTEVIQHVDRRERAAEVQGIATIPKNMKKNQRPAKSTNPDTSCIQPEYPCEKLIYGVPRRHLCP